ncbi:MAG: hypothetical protein CO078_00810 [Candidatus Nealsonbacteria bacterium CG_4_9_14_0_8_um_filter_36_17]|uniref:Uncharacterized protein n=2 Tax=Candidatus Nealsoniibacteriota TaxID=1817911 RepID=A0A2M8DLP9_9BACT|nr:MAG: hypothetical protein COX33_00760 [Candidatus Nealsonbacteria bacterium CG23_combo_of_CG06-09_8_20_14_all_36_125]PJB98791.1 MAG: hypothetical protein CO078_00810 [Candidatus Nealsonbacteria bacterium CG_4_9_14_0_8_um_filter_36_17]
MRRRIKVNLISILLPTPYSFFKDQQAALLERAACGVRLLKIYSLPLPSVAFLSAVALAKAEAKEGLIFYYSLSIASRFSEEN